jgi:O-antigen ligase
MISPIYEKYKYLIFSVLSLPLILLMNSGIEIKYFIGLLLLLITLFSLHNFNIIVGMFIASIFSEIIFFNFQVAVIFSIFLLISLLIHFYSLNPEELKSPLNKSMLIFFICVIPSYFYSINPLLSIIKCYQFLAFLVVLYSISIGINFQKKIVTTIMFYLAIVSLDSILVIVRGLITKDRVFGFSGVYYVDFVGVGLILSLILFLYSSGWRRFIFIILICLQSLGIILTETRNAWISVLLSLVFMLIFMIIKGDKLKIKRSSVIKFTLITIFAFTSIFLVSSLISGGVQRRINAVASKTVLTDDPSSVEGNSLLSRVFIWHTAYLAFRSHPVFGIGIYSFPFSSSNYYKIPKAYFKMYVENLPPHLGYLAILTETGIVGFIGFIIFLSSMLSFAYSSIKNSITKEDFLISILLFFALIYVTISLAMTDAWLWGQQLMLWGLLLGLCFSNSKILKARKLANG